MSHFIDGVLEPALWFLAEWSLRWAVVIGLLAVGLAVARPRRAATRHLVCWLVLLAGLVLPAWPRWGPGLGNWPPPAPPGGDEVAHPESPLTFSPVPGPRELVLPHAEGEGHRPVVPAAHGPHPSGDPEARPDVAPVVEPLGTRRLVILSLALLWTAGVVVMGTRWAGGWLLLRRMRRTAGAVPEACARVFEACRAELGLRRRATLAAHALVWSPLTLGLARPLILVPPAWPDVPPPVQRAGLLHELAHLARYDDWAALALELLRAVFFFHPLVHWLLARIERERELLCDETVLARGIEPRAYVRMLLDFSRQPGRLLPAALLGQPHSLGFGRRRTVKARIHHLLEENMSRWMSPLSPRRALALGTVVLALAVGLGSLRVRALAPEAEPDPPEPAQPPAAREDGGTRPAAEGGQQAEKALPTAERKEALRYGGKNFYEWRAELTTELKPEIRVEGLKALSAFGANGYEKEAAAAILEVVRGYDVALGDPDDGKVIDAAQQALAKIGPVAVQALTAEFKAGTRNSRRFALKALLRIGANDKSMVPVFLAALKDEDAYVRRSVIGDLFRSGNIPKAVDFAPALVGALKDEDPQVRSLAVEKLERIALHAKSSAKSAVPVLIELLRDQDSHIRILVAQTLRAIGPDAKAAVPALTELLKEDNLTLRMIATDALNKIGK